MGKVKLSVPLAGNNFTLNTNPIDTFILKRKFKEVKGEDLTPVKIAKVYPPFVQQWKV